MRFDTHIHTSHYSPCGKMTKEELLNAAIEANLDGLVVTDHSLGWLPWPDEAWLPFQKMAEERGITILRGVEMTCRDRKHYLIYGNLEFLSPDGLVPPEQEWTSELYDQTPDPDKFVALAQREGCFVAIAHAYRKPDAEIPSHIQQLGLDGVEVQSNNLRTELQQNLGLALAKNLSCIATAGSDGHAKFVVGTYGLDFEQQINNEEEFVSALKSGNFHRFQTEKRYCSEPCILRRCKECMLEQT